MARLVYALAGYGRGHTSRALASASVLRSRGHSVTFCCGGLAKVRLEALGEQVIDVTALPHVIQGNQGSLFKTILANVRPFALGTDFRALCERLEAARPDLLLADFEPFAPLAAGLLRVPVASLNHQQIVTETRYRVPKRYRLSAALTSAAIGVMTPLQPQRIFISSFYYPALKRPQRTTLLPPVLREAVLGLTPQRGEHVLVYFNGGQGLERFLERLAKLDAAFTVYNVENPGVRPANVEFKNSSDGAFLRDLATCRGVICTAGFNLISEALFLGKPILAVPNRGFFEQTLNALHLEREGLGRASFNGLPSKLELTDFLTSPVQVKRRLELGNDALAKEIDALLHTLLPPTFTVKKPKATREVASS